ncbi:hypothetical protein NO2_1563, partial [Candidatus Termititenax persephonae]
FFKDFADYQESIYTLQQISPRQADGSLNIEGLVKGEAKIPGMTIRVFNPQGQEIIVDPHRPLSEILGGENTVKVELDCQILQKSDLDEVMEFLLGNNGVRSVSIKDKDGNPVRAEKHFGFLGGTTDINVSSLFGANSIFIENILLKNCSGQMTFGDIANRGRVAKDIVDAAEIFNSPRTRYEAEQIVATCHSINVRIDDIKKNHREITGSSFMYGEPLKPRHTLYESFSAGIEIEFYRSNNHAEQRKQVAEAVRQPLAMTMSAFMIENGLSLSNPSTETETETIQEQDHDTRLLTPLTTPYVALTPPLEKPKVQPPATELTQKQIEQWNTKVTAWNEVATEWNELVSAYTDCCKDLGMPPAIPPAAAGSPDPVAIRAALQEDYEKYLPTLGERGDNNSLRNSILNDSKAVAEWEEAKSNFMLGRANAVLAYGKATKNSQSLVQNLIERVQDIGRFSGEESMKNSPEYQILKASLEAEVVFLSQDIANIKKELLDIDAELAKLDPEKPEDKERLEELTVRRQELEKQRADLDKELNVIQATLNGFNNLINIICTAPTMLAAQNRKNNQGIDSANIDVKNRADISAMIARFSNQYCAAQKLFDRSREDNLLDAAIAQLPDHVSAFLSGTAAALGGQQAGDQVQAALDSLDALFARQDPPYPHESELRLAYDKLREALLQNNLLDAAGLVGFNTRVNQQISMIHNSLEAN